jgi:uncharacterized protein YdaU (DUF1376 family)
MTDSYYPFYPGDYLRDTQDLSLIEHGAYRILLDHYYCDQKLPSEKDRLYRICRAFSVEEQNAVDNVVSRYFKENGDGLLINNRADKEINKRKAFINEQSRKGKLSVKVRREKKNRGSNRGSTGVQTEGVTEPLTEAQPKFNPPSPSPSPSLSPPSPPPPNIDDSIESLSPEQGTNHCPHQKIIDLYHEVLPELPQIKIWPENLKKILRVRWKENPERQNLEWWRKYFLYVKSSPFLMGQKTSFLADLEWIIRPTNFSKIANGRYHRDTSQFNQKTEQNIRNLQEWMEMEDENEK